MSKDQLEWEQLHLARLNNLAEWCKGDPIEKEIERNIQYTEQQIKRYEKQTEKNEGRLNNG